jgi:hypothetical protein
MSNQETVARTDELTDTVQLVTESFPNIKADYRPNGADWYRWLIYDDVTSEVIGVVAIDEHKKSLWRCRISKSCCAGERLIWCFRRLRRNTRSLPSIRPSRLGPAPT